ncbi:hypothetical protein MD484_g8300, partial [Candolleomyces efflorescens]
MAAKAAFFHNAQGFSIQSSNFTNHQTTIIQSSAPTIDPSEVLHKHRAIEASHTSKTAESAPKCKVGTRTQAITNLIDWAKKAVANPSPSKKSVLWFRGPAGSGKTCIMREVARICLEDDDLAGDYFFSTRVPGLDNEAPFVATIVAHLIEVVPALDPLIQETILSLPTIFERSMKLQVKKLISNHITSITSQTPSPRIIVVDGFDECRDQKQRERLLHLLHILVTPPHPFCVVIASRPELDIRTAFDLEPLKLITEIVHLERYETSGEIYQYLSDEFARICQTHPAKRSIPLGWPGELTLNALTDKSSGIWAFPSTVIRYVANPRRHPVELLKHVLDASSTTSSDRPFAELDALYEIVLNPPDVDLPLMKRILHVVMEVTRLLSELFGSISNFYTKNILSSSGLDKFLSLEDGTTEMTLCDLHSVLSVTEDIERPWIYFHHKSLEDFLCSPDRSGDLYQLQADTESDILTPCMHHLELWNRKLVGPDANFQIPDENLAFLCVIWKQLLIEKRIFPPAFLDFDFRIVWRCIAFAPWLPPEETLFNNFVDNFHNDMVGVDLPLAVGSCSRTIT